MKTILAAFFLPAIVTAAEPVAVEKGGIITIEAEDFVRQTENTKRTWLIVSADTEIVIELDADPTHLEGASGGAYIEALPDTRTTHDDRLIPGENFTNEPGTIAVLAYPITVTKPGRYYVWARTFSTGTEDNGLHFGLDGTWPESGRRWQTVKKHGWNWDCKQRTEEVHIGVPMQLWLDIEKPGDHEILLGMREDGAEVDQIVLALSPDYRPDEEGDDE